jgi:hypothetical protein
MRIGAVGLRIGAVDFGVGAVGLEDEEQKRPGVTAGPA